MLIHVLESLKSKLENNILEYETPLGEVVQVVFEFNPPASKQEIDDFESSNKIILPEQFKAFLQYTNGAVLYKGTGYDEGGYRLHSIDNLLQVTNKFRTYGYEIDNQKIVFAEVFGYSDFLVFDLNHVISKPREIIIDGDAGYNSNNWNYIRGDFFSWLNRIIITNGDMYWRWY